MQRLTHKRESGMKFGYWSPNKKQELVDRLAMYEDAAEKDRFGKWIPCSERLPKTGEYVLISCEGFSTLGVGKYEEDDIGGTFYLNEDIPCEDFGIAVEAWRPLPEPYKE